MKDYQKCVTNCKCPLRGMYKAFAELQRKIHISHGDEKRILVESCSALEKKIFDAINKCGNSDVCLTELGNPDENN